MEWKRYEQVAAQLIDMMKAELGLEAVDGPMSLPGKSGTSWAIDVTARRIGGGTVIVECRRKKRRLAQEDVAAVAYRINDTGSAGGITVSPEPLQAGAALVAKAEGIVHVELNAESTATDYVMRLLGRCFIGASVREQLNVQDQACAVVIRDGKEVP